MAGVTHTGQGEEPPLLQPNEEDEFRTVKHSRREQKPRNKRRREGSIAIENLSMRTESSSSEDQNTIQNRQSELKVLITPIDKSKSLKNVNPITIARNIREACPNPVEFIKPTAQGLLIKCKNQKQVKALSQISIIGTTPVKVAEKQQVMRGVIYGVPTEMTDDEIRNELKHQGVIDVKRIMKRSKSNVKSIEIEESRPNFIPMRSVIITFNRTNLPSNVTMCYQHFEVKLYIPPVLRCFQCQRYGHGIAQCKAKMRCVRCGEDHKFEECNRKERPICINCGGNHSAAFDGCLVAKKAKKIQIVKVQNNLSYAQAAKVQSEQEKAQQKPRANLPESHPSLDVNSDNLPLPPRPVRPSTAIRPENATPQPDPQPWNTPLQKNAQSSIDKNGKTEVELEALPRGNLVTLMSDEQLISFITQLVLTFTDGKSEKEISSLVKVAAERLLKQRVKHDAKDVLV